MPLLLGMLIAEDIGKNRVSDNGRPNLHKIINKFPHGCHEGNTAKYHQETIYVAEPTKTR